MAFYAGIDWASEEHALCVVDDEGKVHLRLAVRHTAEGLADMRRRLGKFNQDGALRIAIERPSGLLVDTLLEAGLIVVPIHPNVVKATRSRYSAARAKSDAGDAYLLADLLRTDGHRFRPLSELADETKALRALVRTREDLVQQRVALANRLRALLESFWAGAACIFADIDSPIALAFLRRYPTPASAKGLNEKRMAAFMARHAYCGRRTANELLARLNAAPATACGTLEAEAKGDAVLALVAILHPLVEQIQQLTAATEHALEAHPDGGIVSSLPRSGRINAAQILAELGDDRTRFLTADQLAAEAGVAPVTRASGKHHAVGARYACNKRLKQAITCLADNSRHSSAWAADVYRRARLRGCDHPHAIRILARSWTRVLWSCWQHHTPYLESSHQAAFCLKIQV